MSETTKPDHQELPYLPSLESAKTTDCRSAYILAYPVMLISWLTVPTLASLTRYRQFVDCKGLAIIILMLALLGWVAFRLLSGFHSFQADRSGLTMRGVLRRRLIPWAQVIGLSVRTTRAGFCFVELHLGGGERVRFVPRGLGGSEDAGAAVTASIWQHLRQMGRAEDTTLPEDVLRIWKPVWDDVPVEVDWSRPVHRWARFGRFLTSIVFMAMAIGILLCFADKGWRGLLFSAPISVMCWLALSWSGKRRCCLLSGSRCARIALRPRARRDAFACSGRR